MALLGRKRALRTLALLLIAGALFLFAAGAASGQGYPGPTVTQAPTTTTVARTTTTVRVGSALSRTGGDVLQWSLVAVALVGAGAAVVLLSRRRNAPTS